MISNSFTSSYSKTMAYITGSSDLPMSGFPKGTGVTAECEITYEGGDSIEKLHGECKKHPGHTSFIPVPDFKISDFPEEYQTEKMMNKMKDLCDLTVKILIKYISLERPDTYADSDEKYPYGGKMRGSKRIRRYGTGFVRSLVNLERSRVQGERCPCPLCKDSDSPQMEYWTLLVGTATHVIFDDSEAACAVIECFYDTQDRVEVKTMYGLSLMKRSLEFNKHQSDACYLNCVTHDKDLFEKLHELCCNYNFTFLMERFESPLAYVIAHPHGCSKRITFGKLLHFTVPIDTEYPVETPVMFAEGTRCRMPQLPWWKIHVAKDEESDLNDMNTPKQNSPVDLADANTTTKKTASEKDPDEKVLKTIEVRDSTGNLSDREVVDVNTEDHRNALHGTHQQASQVEDKENVCQELKQASNNTENVSHNETKAAISDCNKTDKISSFRLTSTVSDDYTQLGATSLSFQELNMASANSGITGMNPQLSNKETNNENLCSAAQYLATPEMVSEGACLPPSFEESNEGEFLPTTGLSFKSLFEDIMPPIPPGVSMTLPPEVNYLLKTPDYDSRFSFEPGKQCVLPFGTSFTLPSTAKFAMRFASLKPHWFTLPPGTKITLPDGKTILLPPEAEFLTEMMQVRFIYVTFDMATCPGSSGAIIHQEGVRFMGLPFSVHNFSHFGAMVDGYNRSGLQNFI